LCNSADLPMFGIEIAANLYMRFGTDHSSSPSSWNAWEGIDKAAWASTDRAPQIESGWLVPMAGNRSAQRERRRHGDRFSTAEWWRRNARKGTLIRHAGGRVT
jgi:hypothetical protein